MTVIRGRRSVRPDQALAVFLVGLLARRSTLRADDPLPRGVAA